MTRKRTTKADLEKTLKPIIVGDNYRVYHLFDGYYYSGRGHVMDWIEVVGPDGEPLGARRTTLQDLRRAMLLI